MLTLHARISLVLIYLAWHLSLAQARVVKSVDTADLKSADSKKSCRFDSGLGHHQNIAKTASWASYEGFFLDFAVHF